MPRKTRAEEANKAKSKISGEYEHELRNAATRHHRIFRVMESGMFGALGAEKFMKIAATSARAANICSIINDIRHVQIEAGRIRLELVRS